MQLKRIYKKLNLLLVLTMLALPGKVLANRWTDQLDTVARGAGFSETDGQWWRVVAVIINSALGFLGLITIGFIIYGGFVWMTAAGDESKITQAKKILKSSLVGLVIVLSSLAIANFVFGIMGIGVVTVT